MGKNHLQPFRTSCTLRLNLCRYPTPIPSLLPVLPFPLLSQLKKPTSRKITLIAKHLSSAVGARQVRSNDAMNAAGTKIPCTGNRNGSATYVEIGSRVRISWTSTRKGHVRRVERKRGFPLTLSISSLRVGYGHCQSCSCVLSAALSRYTYDFAAFEFALLIL